MFPCECFFNHSCSSNAAWRIDRHQGGVFIAEALQTIEEGQEVLISYFGDERSVSTNRRLEYLRDYYQFDCSCARCTSAKDCYLCEEEESKYTCSRCKGIKYCSAECQRKHWPSHKKECAALALAVGSSSPSTTLSSMTPPSGRSLRFKGAVYKGHWSGKMNEIHSSWLSERTGW